VGQQPVGVSAELVAVPGAPGPKAWPALVVRLDPSGSGVRVSGEVDLVTRSAWAELLADLAATGDDIELDLSGVSFIDVGGATALARAAQRLPPGRRLRIHHPPLCLRYLVDLLWGPLTTIEMVP
jgi:ABC-type transporter Mla MlaB component